MTEPEPQPEKEKEKEAAQAVPYDRFKEVNDRSKALEQELEALRKERDEREAAELSELEKERKARENAERERDEAKNAATELTRSGLIRAAAAKAGFTDPDDAVAFIDLSTIEDEGRAESAIKSLAERKAHLVATKPDTRRGVEKVLSPEATQKKEPDQPEPEPGYERLQQAYAEDSGQ